MKTVSHKLIVAFLLVLAAGLFLFFRSEGRKQAGPPEPYPTFNQDVEMTSQEVIDSWLEEQAGEAREFFQEHEELFDQIVEVALDPEADEALSELLTDYDITYTRTVSGLLQLNYAFTEFPTAIFCDVSFRYNPDFSSGGEYDLGSGWHIQADYHHMYGL